MTTEMTSGYSLADIGAMLGNKSDGFLEGNGIIILILFFLIFGANGGMFGNAASAATGTITNDFLYTNLASQNREEAAAINAGFANAATNNFGLQKDILQSTTAIQSDICAGINGINTNIASLASQMAQQCCDLKTAVHSEGETTRALITENTISQLRTDLQSAQMTLANANQTQNILNNLGSYQPYNGSCNCS